MPHSQELAGRRWPTGDRPVRCLGHVLPDNLQEVYSHVADEVEYRLIASCDSEGPIYAGSSRAGG